MRMTRITFPDTGTTYHEGTCDACGATLERYKGESDISCDCGAEYNAFGQRLRSDWRGNSSNWDSDVSDLEGFELQHLGDE